MTLGIPELWLGLREEEGKRVEEGRNKMDAGMQGEEKWKGNQREKVRLIET